MARFKGTRTRAIDIQDTTTAALEGSVLRAGIAAAAAEKLVSRALEVVLDATEYTPELGLLLDQFHICSTAASRVAGALAAGAMIDISTWDVVLTALAWMNNRCWQQTSGDQYVQHFLLQSTAEQLLIDHLARGAQGNLARKKQKAVGPVILHAHADALVEPVLALAGGDAVLAVHLLVGITTRALGEACFPTCSEQGGD